MPGRKSSVLGGWVGANGNAGLAGLLQDVRQAERGTDTITIWVFVGQQGDAPRWSDQLHGLLYQQRINLCAQVAQVCCSSYLVFLRRHLVPLALPAVSVAPPTQTDE